MPITTRQENALRTLAAAALPVAGGTRIHQHTLGALYARGYVECVGTGDDRRVQITEKGRAALAAAHTDN